MSCQVKLTANIQDIAAIRRCLFPTDDQRGSDSWLQMCEISACPTGDIITIANERRLVVLTSKWDSQTGLSNLHITYSSSIHDYDKVKAVLCLPIVGQTQSSHVGPDWTCIMVGYDSGYVRFYTESCELLFEEQFHCESVCRIKCQSQHSPRPDISPELKPEEIYVQYQSNVSVLNGSQLFTNLRNLRGQLARQTKPTFEALLQPRKWGFQDQNVINDSSVVGLNLCSTFDHLLTASTCGGFETKYRTVPPNNTLVLGAGSKPFVGYHYALEGGAQPVLSDVAKAVANKLKSALPGWLTGGSKVSVDKQMTVALQPAEAMGCRFGLCDLRRTATNLILSPDRKLAAVADTLGRVLLIDSFRGVVLRIFKGYRDAECAFIQVPDERKSKHKIGNRVALFLIIYSSKKGTLEIFAAQQGTKIATFTAAKFSRLLYIDYGLMGFVGTTKSRYICQFTTLFVDNDGAVKELLIPFHFALTEKNNARSRDIHLYKKLRQMIKAGDSSDQLEQFALNTCAELRTSEMKFQTVEMILNNKSVPADIKLKCVQFFLKTVDNESSNLKNLIHNSNLLLSLYLFVQKYEFEDSDSGDNEDYLKFDEKTQDKLQKLLDLNKSIDGEKMKEVKVTFSDVKDFTSTDFLKIFDLSNSAIKLRKNSEENALFSAGEILFRKFVLNSAKSNVVEREFQMSQIPVYDLFYLLINFWVNRLVCQDLRKEMQNFAELINLLVKTANPEEFVCDYSSESKFWASIRDILANSARPFPALTAAILCKTIAHKLEFEDDIENMEILSQENCQWGLLIGKLEDVSLLNIILSTRPTVTASMLPKLPQEPVNVSLKYVLKGGKGIVSELVAKWISATGLNPELIVVNELTPEDVIKEPLFQHFNMLKQQFPFSLDVNAVLANLSWEYALNWQKDIQNIQILEASIKCLNVIPSTNVKLGLYNLLWNTHLKILYESVGKLINKVGKLPKERLCRQDTGLSDYQITLLTGICTEFLDNFIEVLKSSFGAAKFDLNFEQIWENSGPQPLIELAVNQMNINPDLLLLHYQFSLALYMISTFAIKHSKPINNLFDPFCVNLLFADFQKPVEIDWERKDLKIDASRVQFLMKIISASIETIVVDEETIYSSEHVNWMGKCLTIARYWNLDVDALKRYQIVQLYGNGYDLIAEELISAVNNKNLLAKELLVVAAKRLSQFLRDSPALSENISALSPVLTQFFTNLNGDWCFATPLNKITTLAEHVCRHLDERQPEHKIAHQLLDACLTLQQIQS